MCCCRLLLNRDAARYIPYSEYGIIYSIECFQNHLCNYSNMANPNPKPPSRRGGPTKQQLVQRRGLAFACRDAVSDEELVEWLLTIAVDGKWPVRSRPVHQGKAGPAKVLDTDPTILAMPPGEPMRKYAFEEFIRRRDGQPMQAVMISAEVEARKRLIDNAADVIDIAALSPSTAQTLESLLMQAIAAPKALSADDDDEE